MRTPEGATRRLSPAGQGYAIGGAFARWWVLDYNPHLVLLHPDPQVPVNFLEQFRHRKVIRTAAIYAGGACPVPQKRSNANALMKQPVMFDSLVGNPEFDAMVAEIDADLAAQLQRVKPVVE